jgi:hypothetical protein
MENDPNNSILWIIILSVLVELYTKHKHYNDRLKKEKYFKNN